MGRQFLDQRVEAEQRAGSRDQQIQGAAKDAHVCLRPVPAATPWQRVAQPQVSAANHQAGIDEQVKRAEEGEPRHPAPPG